MEEARNNEKSEFLDLVDFEGVAFSVETVIQNSSLLPLFRVVHSASADAG